MNNNNLTEEQLILKDITEDIMDMIDFSNIYEATNAEYDQCILSIYHTLKKAGYINNDTTE